MTADDREGDDAVEWLSLEMPRNEEQRSHGAVFYLAISGAVLLMAVTLVVAARRFAEWQEPTEVTISIHGLGDSGRLRAESVTAFASYDAADPIAGLPDEERREREAILRFFGELERCQPDASNAQTPADEAGDPATIDIEKFHRLVDFDRLTDRVLRAAQVATLSAFEKRFLRGELKSIIELEDYWADITVVRIIAAPDDPSSRIVYAYGTETDGTEQSEVRFLIARDDDAWRLYDWERLDLGMYTSEEWGIYARLGDSPRFQEYVQWGEAMGEVDALLFAGEYEQAKEKLRQSHTLTMPRELSDLRWTLTAYRWQALGDPSTAEDCYQKVLDPDEIPGVYYGLMNCYQQDKLGEALKYAELYEASVGVSLDFCTIKAQILERMGQTDQAIAEWHKALRIDPDHVESLRSLVLALPEGDKQAIGPLLQRLQQPAETLSTLGEWISWQDYDGLQHVTSELEHHAPGSADLLYLQGILRQYEGDLRGAADYFHQAHEAETDKDQTIRYATRFIDTTSVLGEGVASWKNLSDPQAVFRAIALDYYEYGDSQVSQGDFEQLVDQYREQFPDAPDGVYYAASIAIERQEYTAAETILREGLQGNPPPAEDAEAPIDRESLLSLLADVLYHQGQVREAYAVEGDRKERFAQLGSLAAHKQRYDQLGELLEIHRQLEPDDPRISYVTGAIAAGDGRWDDAVREYQRALDAEPESWEIQFDLREAYVESGRWLEYYTRSDEQQEEFASLARSFLADKQWDSLSQLIEEHRRRWPEDAEARIMLVKAAWEREEYSACIGHAEQLLADEISNDIPAYQHQDIEDKLFRSFLRTGAIDRAHDLALRHQQTSFDSLWLAIAEAAAGNLAEAEQAAIKYGAESKSLAALYRDELVGSVFLGERFEALHRTYPVEGAPDTTPTEAVFLSENDWPLDAEQLQTALEEAGVGGAARIVPIKSVRPEVSAAFVIRLDQGNLWIAAGSGRYQPEWAPEDKASPTAVLAEQCDYWLACGPAAWSPEQREELRGTLGEFVAPLIAEKATLFYARNAMPWHEYRLYPVRTDLIDAWQDAREMKAVRDEGLAIEESYRDRTTSADRQFECDLREAARSFSSEPANDLELLVDLDQANGICTVRLKVIDVEKSYHGPLFHGLVVKSSEVLPELRQGLPMRVRPNEVYAWRLNSEPAVFRAR